ncbi:MAG: hypothetical protein ABFS12_12235 [Bacteroidota bacterium]
MEEIHRFANEGVISVLRIETQVGKYAGEDDFKRN